MRNSIDSDDDFCSCCQNNVILFICYFTGVSCPPVANPKMGTVSVLGGIFLQLSCSQGHFFNPSPPGLSAIFENPFYRCISKKWTNTKDGVSILTKSSDCMGMWSGFRYDEESVFPYRICLLQSYLQFYHSQLY